MCWGVVDREEYTWVLNMVKEVVREVEDGGSRVGRVGMIVCPQLKSKGRRLSNCSEDELTSSPLVTFLDLDITDDLKLNLQLLANIEILHLVCALSLFLDYFLPKPLDYYLSF